MTKWNISAGIFSALLFLLSPTLFAADAGGPALTPPQVPELNGIQDEEKESEPKDAKEAEEESDGEEEEDSQQSIDSVWKNIENEIQENSADDLLNLATEVKLTAESILDLTKVIAYCTEAQKKGLSEDSLEYCKQLLLSSQLERGLAIGEIFMVDSESELPQNWEIGCLMALDDLEAVVQETPDLPAAQLVIGRIKMLLDKQDEAVKAFEMVINAEEADPELLAEALKYRAILEEDNDKSLEDLNRAVEINPDRPEYLNLLAARLNDMRQEEKAVETIDKAIALDPDEPKFKKTKALILASMGQKEEAKQLYDEAVSGNDEFIAQVERGQFLMTIEEYETALTVFDKLIEERPVSFLYYLRATLLLQMKEYQKALKDVNKSIGMNPDFTEALRLKALIYIQQERYDDAIPLLEKIRRRDTGDEGVTAQLAYIMAQNNDFTGGMKRLDSLLETNPDSVALLRGKADMYLMYGRWNDAVTYYKKILEQHPADSGALNNYAWLLATSPDDSVRSGAEAVALATRAAEATNYRESYILSTLAAAYAETGDFEKARQWSAQAVELAEKDGEERLDDLKKELESYKEDKPWREEQQKTGDASDPLPEEAADFF